jgi:uncharacterized protein
MPLVDTRMPGVYTLEIPTLPPSIAVVPSAVPCFIGFTQRADKDGEPIIGATRIRNMREYVAWFGGADPQAITVEVTDKTDIGGSVQIKGNAAALEHRMYYALQLYYANGGGPCFILPLVRATPTSDPYTADFFKTLNKTKDITILVMPDAVKSANYGSAIQQSLLHCSTAVNRVAILDVDDVDSIANITSFRGLVPSDIAQKKYGAAYYPFLNTTLDYVFDGDTTMVTIKKHTAPLAMPSPLGANQIVDPLNANHLITTTPAQALKALEATQNDLYNKIIAAIRAIPVPMPPSAAIAGVMVQTDATQGVWKAPANVSLANVIMPTVEIDDDFHAELNVDANTGKSVNAIRAYSGKGILVFGARTLAGNDLEWRYISVRRTFCFIEDSIARAMQDFIFAPNTRDTWIKVKSMISNFLNNIWLAGGLFGNISKEAYVVNVGFPETMSDVDILEGKMIVEIKLRVSRPAEFIILRYEHKFQTNLA